jgi:argininosuccinate lyase
MTLYRGRIAADQRGLMDAINRSLPTDFRLLPFDAQTNKAWAGELRRLGLLTAAEQAAIEGALDQIVAQAAAGAFAPLPPDEDVHTLVERLLTEKLGETGAKIHAGRSRNDQVVCDVRLYAAAALAELLDEIDALARALVELAARHATAPIAGETHLQPAQPITLGFFLLSLAFGLARDLERLTQARARANRCPLGSGALAGSGFPVDRARLAAALGFDGICENALDAIGDRDFAAEIAAGCALLCTRLSRYAEQFVIWANPAFGGVRFGDQWSTGSSMMPQKRNPDAMELVRGKAARVIGDLTALLALLKGAPPSYVKDLQEDKTALFDALDTALLAARVFRAALGDAEFALDRLAAALRGEMLATDLADELVRAGAPFRLAHERVARLIGELEAASRSLLDLAPADLAQRFPELAGRDFAIDYAASIARRNVAGGTAPEAVRKQIEVLGKTLDEAKVHRAKWITPRA